MHHDLQGSFLFLFSQTKRRKCGIFLGILGNFYKKAVPRAHCYIYKMDLELEALKTRAETAGQGLVVEGTKHLRGIGDQIEHQSYPTLHDGNWVFGGFELQSLGSS